MLNHKPYHFNLLYKLTVAFGNLFNEISIVRFDSNRKEIQRIAVPLSYGPKEKFLVRLKQDPQLSERAAIVLPRMAFQINSIAYDPRRKLQKTGIRSRSKANSLLKQYNPVPWNVDYTLSIMTDVAEDGTQILEQILPFFTPEFSVTVAMVEDMQENLDIPFILNSITHEDDYDNDFKEHRSMAWNLNFTAKMDFYGFIREQGVIRKSIVDIYIPPTADGIAHREELDVTPRSERITVTPNPPWAEKEESYGFDKKLESFFDGKKRNPATGLDEDIQLSVIITPPPARIRVEQPPLV